MTRPALTAATQMAADTVRQGHAFPSSVEGWVYPCRRCGVDSGFEHGACPGTANERQLAAVLLRLDTIEAHLEGVERIENMLSRLNTAAQRLVELAEFIQENGL